MRILKLIAICLASVFIGCSDDGCTIEDWEGTYIGTKSCGTDSEFDYQFEVTKLEAVNEESSRVMQLDGFNITVADCIASGGSMVSSMTSISIDGNLIDNKLNVTITFANESCTWIGTKQ